MLRPLARLPAFAAPALTAAAALALGLAAGAARADGFACGTRLVTEGMAQYEVERICGEPAEVTRTQILRRPVIWRHGRPWYLSDEPVVVPVETWLYDFGPNRLMRKLRFEDGELKEIETLGHGYGRQGR
jgi:hypothetical protein